MGEEYLRQNRPMKAYLDVDDNDDNPAHCRVYLWVSDMKKFLRFEPITVVITGSTAFWKVMLFSLVELH
jgi:hypothetical protein